MKRFMETNEVTHNLMSFSGFKSILIFSLLAESPKTYSDIQKALEENEYLHESISFDTIRIYINSLKEAGCKIESEKRGKQTKYYIASHPFKLKISDKQAKSIIKIYKAISKSIDIFDYLALQQFFLKISKYIANEDLKIQIENLSPLCSINPELVKDLMHYTNKKARIKILYNSPNSGKKEIDIAADKLSITNGKLYLSGVNSEYNNYYSFPVSKIIKILSVNINPAQLNIPAFKAVYEYYKTDNNDLELITEEKVLKRDENKILVEISSKNKFSITQRILSLSNKCKVISPQSYKEEIIECLNKMKEGYFGKEK